MVIFGWLKRVTFLGSKLEQCHKCTLVADHYLARNTYWGHVFWIPVVLLGFRHGMLCGNCGAWTGISILDMRRAMRDRLLPLARVRPALAEMQKTTFDETYRRPSEAELFDSVVVNPKRGLFDLYFKAWPLLVLGLVVAIVVLAAR